VISCLDDLVNHVALCAVTNVFFKRVRNGAQFNAEAPCRLFILVRSSI
jgi:hypothetical protein